MRFVGLVLLCAGLLPAQPAPDKCRLEGKVLNSITGAPVRKAQVILIGGPTSALGQSAAPSMLVRLTATTDGEGRFVFEGLDAGRYSATPLRDGFRSPAALAQRPELALLGPGEEKRDLILRLDPLGVISGHVLDADGDPVRRASVRVMTYQPTATGRLALTPGRLAFTNDVGEYRFFDLPPGRYYIRAVAFPAVSPTPSGSNEDSYAPAYYPEGSDASTASAIELRPGQERGGADITVRRVRPATVSGRLVTPVGAAQSSVQLIPANAGRVNQDPQGGFQTRLPPGSYVLAADASVGGKAYAARVPLQVASDDIKDLVVPLVPTLDMNGRVKIEGEPPAAPGGTGGAHPMSQISVRLNGRYPQPTIRGTTPSGSPAGPAVPSLADGTVVFRDLAPDIYTVQFTFPSAMYLKSLRCGGAEIADLKIDLTGGSGCELSVVLSYNGGQIEGSVQDENGKPAAAGLIILVPVGANRTSSPSKVGIGSREGRFLFQGVAPGTYKLYAWDDVDTNAVRYDPDFLKPYEALGQVVQISEGASEHVTVKLIKKPAEP